MPSSEPVFYPLFFIHYKHPDMVYDIEVAGMTFVKHVNATEINSNSNSIIVTTLGHTLLNLGINMALRPNVSDP